MNDKDDEQKIKLEQYRNILGYLQYENRTYWTRSGFMIVAQTTLFGFITKQLPLLEKEPSYKLRSSDYQLHSPVLNYPLEN